MKRKIAAVLAVLTLSVCAYAAETGFPEIKVGEKDSEGRADVSVVNTFDYPILRKSSYYNSNGDAIWYARTTLLQKEEFKYKPPKSTEPSEEEIVSKEIRFYLDDGTILTMRESDKDGNKSSSEEKRKITAEEYPNAKEISDNMEGLKPVITEENGKTYIRLEKNPLSKDIISIDYNIRDNGKDAAAEIKYGGVKAGEGSEECLTIDPLGNLDNVEVTGADLKIDGGEGKVENYYLDFKLGEYINKYREVSEESTEKEQE